MNQVFPNFDDYMSRLNESGGMLGLDVSSFNQWLAESANGEDPLRAEAMGKSREEILHLSDRIIQLSKQKIYNYYPMYRPFMNIMPPTPRFGAGSRGPDGMGTMSTSGSAIFYDPYFVYYIYLKGKVDFKSEMDSEATTHGKAGKTTPLFRVRKGLRDASDYCTFIIIHEVMHNSLKHFLRQVGKIEGFDFGHLLYLWNIATDYEINHMLKRDPRTSLVKPLPGIVQADVEGTDFFWPEDEVDEAGNNIREFFMTARAERIFWRMIRNIQEEQKKEKGDEEEDEDQDGGDGGDEENEDGSEGDEEGEDGDGEDRDGDGEGDESDGDGNGEGDGEGNIKVGDSIWDGDAGVYGKVTSISGDDIEYTEIPEDQAFS